MPKEAREQIIEKTLEGVATAAFTEAYADANSSCKAAGVIAANFDRDDWALGQVDGCLATVATFQGQTALACRLYASEIVHLEGVKVPLSPALTKNMQRNLATARNKRVELRCN